MPLSAHWKEAITNMVIIGTMNRNKNRDWVRDRDRDRVRDWDRGEGRDEDEACCEKQSKADFPPLAKLSTVPLPPAPQGPGNSSFTFSQDAINPEL